MKIQCAADGGGEIGTPLDASRWGWWPLQCLLPAD
jgi:hypothetical protein